MSLGVEVFDLGFLVKVTMCQMESRQ